MAAQIITVDTEDIAAFMGKMYLLSAGVQVPVF